MAKKWCHNARTGEIFSYNQTDGYSDFSRGTFLAYGDYLTTGFTSKEDAQAWAKEWGRCDKCRAARKPDENGNCPWCGNKVEFVGALQ